IKEIRLGDKKGEEMNIQLSLLTIYYKAMNNEEIELLAVASSPSDGLKKGVVVDIQKTVSSIKKSIFEAEFISGIKIEHATIGISGSHINSFNSHGAVPIKSKEVKSFDITNVLNSASTISIPEGQQILHVIPQFYAVDGQDKILDPLGMYGVRLESWVHVITGSIATVQNLINCCQLAGVTVSDVILEQLASAESVLTKDERELGVAVIDIGGGTSDFALYHQGALKHTFVIPSAGNHLTQDVAIGFNTTLGEAEKLKHNICSLNQDEQNYLRAIVRARAQEIFSIAYDEIQQNNLFVHMSKGLVLTGGGSLLDGIIDDAQEVFGCHIRVGLPKAANKL
ncbi:MAG: cell division protein FtsA, partial [Gammaproteobacteria bacterium]|nr:cell division protein FtsA [Gammaproteobacteria bacterium]